MSYEYERVATPAAGLRLHLNENTAGCSPKVLEALHSITRQQAAFYPDYSDAVEATAERLGVTPDRLLLTNGLDEGILTTAVTMLRPADGSTAEAIVVVPAFDMYAACSEAAGGRVIEVPFTRDFSFPRDRVLSSIGDATRLVFITNPNNPTGASVAREAILEIARAAPRALVFVDEAYADFAGETLIGAEGVSAARNLIVGRTFAKAYGLAGLRIGALVGDPGTLAPIRRVVPPYSLNACAVVALRAALADTAYRQWYLDQVRSSKDILYRALDRLGVRYWPSAANFLLADFGADARRIVDGLAARQVFVRDKSTDPACPGCIRITAGIVEHTEACVAALEEVLCAGA